MKILLCFAIFFSIAFSQNVKLSDKDQNLYKNIAPSYELGYEEKIKEDPYISNSSLALNAENYKDNYYVNEVFSIELIVKTNEDTNFEIIVTPVKNDELVFLNKHIKWKFTNGEYKSTLYFQAKNSNAKLDKIEVKLSKNKQIFQKANININPIFFKNINYDKNYSHIVANNLAIKKNKASIFDKDNLILMLEVKIKNGNLQSFFINDIKKQGVENIKGNFSNNVGYYYAILPKYIKNFSFSYFNTEKQSLENINLKIQLNEETISTQSDLNPQNKDFDKYKVYILWSIAFLLAFVFVFKKNYILLIISLFCFASSFLIDTSTHLAKLKPNSKVKILPTSQSVYFYTNKHYEEVQILNKRKNYVKIILQNGKIGWVDNANLQKN